MKKTFLTLAGIMAIGQAAAFDWYSHDAVPFVQVDLGVSHVHAEPNFAQEVSANAFTQRVSLGLDFKGDRFALDFTNYGSFKSDIGNAKIFGVALDYTHAFGLNHALRPYLGVRLGYSRVSGDIKDNHALYAMKMGLEIDAFHNTTVGLGAEYGSMHNSKGTALTSGAFLRYYF